LKRFMKNEHVNTSSGIADRAAGAIVGALIGDALGLGPHWYYDLDEMRRDFGPWITTYTEPKKGRYHAGMRAGQLSQTGLILAALLRQVVENKDYSEEVFTRWLDQDLFNQLDGTPFQGPGGYTNQSIREAFRRRKVESRPWGEVGGTADTTEAAERAVVLAALYAGDPAKLALVGASNCRLLQSDPAIVAMTTAYLSVLAALVRGEPMKVSISDHLMRLVHDGLLPFHHVTKPDLSPASSRAEADRAGDFSSPDALLTPGYCAEAAGDQTIRIEPAWKVSIVYGMPCAIYHQLPAAYYLAARFPLDFRDGVLNALNGGGQNMSRACLTGGLIGAQVGLSGIPEEFVNGLEHGQELKKLARQLGQLVQQV
jgi:ADP-ribosylglycohydrolase